MAKLLLIIDAGEICHKTNMFNYREEKLIDQRKYASMCLPVDGATIRIQGVT